MFRQLFSVLLISALALSSAFVQPSTTFLKYGALRMSEEEAGAAVQTGTVKWFSTEKGFGFIVPDDGSPDVFVHQTSIKAEGFRSLADGESVEFDTETDPSTGKTKASIVTGPGNTNVQGQAFEAY
mmetsp:Transcript_21731/g.25879  ORF Transcript_21731/g.25879 Transcript_21731/m.25879 type:complete len:126 (-) Transcript_21731:196-573(-)|eukprot:CAMPEP_0198253672 /NCGR_PEP_ID=MMETSP1447-20131203/4075_1 /TAXON_ID=420782 /ORGANISM="Chaetoceros dichaeta, Strain CCMP1751" /LENGTH=125 /DNA_ID=CAMNT_0043939441 /DNA_START=132 /DNA_END=509 /DNA_ORIENTATION=-